MLGTLLSTATGALFVLAAALTIWGLGHRKAVRRSAIEVRRLQADLEKKTRDLAYFEERNNTLAKDRARIESERDRYRAIASSRELPPPSALPDHVRILDPIWTDRIYANHPRINLQRLAADLAEVDEELLVLQIQPKPEGGWTRRMRTTAKRTYTGPIDRILEDLECWLKDDDLRLVERRSEGGVWADDDSPLHFHIELARVTEEKPEVHVRTVEVAVVETKVVERFVEQPVVIEVPTMPGAQVDVTVGLSREEVLALFEVELESKLAELKLERVDGPDSEPPHTSPPGTKDHRKQHSAVIAKQRII